MDKMAKYYSGEDGRVKCVLCPHNCIITEGNTGICGARRTKNGELITENYGKISSMSLDPVEKKPLYHYKPGKLILSVGSFGCNFNCGFCQNYGISKEVPRTEYVSPEKLVEIARGSKDNDNAGIAFTYNEPSIWFEYVYDTALLCEKEKLDVVLVTNGFISPEPLKELLPFITAMNIDLKSYSDEFYKSICGGRIENVLETIEAVNAKTHVEITTLLVNNYNDSEEEIESLAKHLSKINKSMPLHLSRYYPAYKFNEPATPADRVIKCSKAAQKHLDFVYTGNITNIQNNTYCPECGKLLVERNGYSIKMSFADNICPECGKKLNFVL